MPAPNEKEILQRFRAELVKEGLLKEGDSIGTDDETLIRFLRARKHNLKLSKKMFKDCQEWRRTVEGVGIDELYNQIDPFDFPEREIVFKHWPMSFHKTDKKGRPLNIQLLGNVNVPELYKNVSPERHWQTVVVGADCLTREVLPAAARKAGRTVGTCIVIVDLKKFGLSQFWQMKTLARQSFQISQDYFPETMGQLVVLNAPSSFTAIWSVIKGWLSKETQEKVHVLGSDYKKVLLDLVDAENLPVLFGGSCTCGGPEDGSACLLSGAGPWREGRARDAKSKSNSNSKPNGVVQENQDTSKDGVPKTNGDVTRDANGAPADGSSLRASQEQDANAEKEDAAGAHDGGNKQPEEPSMKGTSEGEPAAVNGQAG